MTADQEGAMLKVGVGPRARPPRPVSSWLRALEEAEAERRWGLTSEELDLYDIRGHRARQGDYLSFNAWNRVVRRPLLDPQAAPLLDNKWVFANYYGNLGLPLPETYGLLHPRQGFAHDGSPLRSVGDVVTWLQRTGTKSFVLKPLAGWRGEGVIVVEDTRWEASMPTFLTADGSECTVESLEEDLLPAFRKVTGCILQAHCPRHPWFARYGLDVPNTVRVVTFMPVSGDPVIQAAVLFAGRRGQMVTSWQDGAVSISIDIGTGRLGLGRMLPRFGWSALDQHPDGDREFRNAVLPDWKETCEVSLAAAVATPDLRLVCWELLLTDDGPRLLEGNLSFGLTMLQVHGEGFLKDGTAQRWTEAGVELPDGSMRWGERISGRNQLLSRRVVRRTRRILGGLRDAGRRK